MPYLCMVDTPQDGQWNLLTPAFALLLRLFMFRRVPSGRERGGSALGLILL